MPEMESTTRTNAQFNPFVPLRKTEQDIVVAVDKTLQRMLSDRGYKNIESENNIKPNFPYFIKTSEGTISVLIEPETDLTTLNKARRVQEFLSEDKNDTNNIKHKFLITRKCAVPFYVNEICKLVDNSCDVLVEYFETFRMMIPIVDHVLQPLKFEVLGSVNNEKVGKILADYKMTANEVGKMKATDPIARYYGLTSGDLVRIIRPSPTSGEMFSYRIVVPDHDPMEMLKFD